MDHAQALPLLWRRFQHWWVTPASGEASSSGSTTGVDASVCVPPAFLQGVALASPDMERGVALIRAIDAGGVPLNPMRVNDIGRRLGLEVSTSAPMDETIVRIRQRLTEMVAPREHAPEQAAPADTEARPVPVPVPVPAPMPAPAESDRPLEASARI